MNTSFQPPSSVDSAAEYLRRKQGATAIRHERCLLAAMLGCLAALFLVAAIGCSSLTVVPSPAPTPAAASYDGAEQNSGLVSLTATGAILTPRARERYNALMSEYGALFTPPVTAVDYGVTPRVDGNYDITREGLAKFLACSDWHRMGRLKP